MGLLRRLPKAVYSNYNQSIIKGYDAIAFSFDKKIADDIFKDDLLSNIISKHIIKMKYDSLIEEQVKITSLYKNTNIIWNKHSLHCDLVDKCINYLNVLKVCKMNDYNNILLFIESDTNPSCVKLIKYIAIQMNINIDLGTIL